MFRGDELLFHKCLTKYFAGKIKLSFVSKRNIIVVTDEDIVYDLKRNYMNIKPRVCFLEACEEYGSKANIEQYIETPKIIKQFLCHKNCIDFKSNMINNIARTIDGRIFVWGGDGNLDFANYDSPFDVFENLHETLEDKKIIDISCGLYHTIVLTDNGQVYSWGLNSNLKNEVIMKPYQVKGFNGEKVKAISCSSLSSLALTESGRVFNWGDINISPDELIVLNRAQKIEIDVKIMKISSGNKHSLLLAEDGDIYVIGSNDLGQLGIANENYKYKPLKLIHPQKFIDIATHYQTSISAALSSEYVFYIWGECGQEVVPVPRKTELKSFNEIFEIYSHLSYEPSRGRIINIEQNPKSGYYELFFEEKERLGSGSYGAVFKCQSRIYEKSCAIKKIESGSKITKDFLKELDHSECINYFRDERVVRYFELWLEPDNDRKLTLYIQMELCDKSLIDVIEDFKVDTNFMIYQGDSAFLTPLGYYIASQLCIEIIEGVYYLHNNRPAPIIHRDLKPANIMLKIDSKCRNVVKIGDLGLMTEHLHNKKSDSLTGKSTNDYLDQSHTTDIGDLRYAAPEVLDGTKYNTKADIYSLGVTLRELFMINDETKNNGHRNDSTLLKRKYEELKKLCSNMTDEIYSNRPTCQQILKNKDLWSLNASEFNFYDYYNKIFRSSENSKSYIYSIIDLKYDQEVASKRFSEKLNQCFAGNIKCSHVSKKTVVIVTKNNSFYEFDRGLSRVNNHSMRIALCDDEDIFHSLVEKSKVSEIDSYEGIDDIKDNRWHTIYRFSDGRIYCNFWIQSLPYEIDEDNMPGKTFINYVNNKGVVEICCGDEHTLILTKDGQVYGWGSNECGQVGKGMVSKFAFIPGHVEGFGKEKIKAISCAFAHSMALTEEGNVYMWGLKYIKHENNFNLLVNDKIIQPTPELVKVNAKINKIKCGLMHSLFLSSDGEIYACGDNSYGQLGTSIAKYNELPLKIEHHQKFVDIAAHLYCNVSVGVSAHGSYYIWGGFEGKVYYEPKLTNFKSLNDIFASETYQLTYELMENRVIQFHDFTKHHTYYENNFSEIKALGRGTFGNAWIVEEDRELFAMKKIKEVVKYSRNFYEKFEELQSYIKLENINLVHYYEIWLENTSNQSGMNYLTVYMKMELCDKPLNLYLPEMKSDPIFKFERELPYLNLSSYYIACELFDEILDGINFLHQQNPPIIHGNLNTNNILLKISTETLKVVKIVDFGSSFLRKYTKSANIGIVVEEYKESFCNFMDHKYTVSKDIDCTKSKLNADINNLGVIMEELFEVNSESDYICRGDQSDFEENFIKLCELAIEMKSESSFKNETIDCRRIKERQIFISSEDDKKKACLHFVKASNSVSANDSYTHFLINHKLSHLINSVDQM